MGNSAISFQLSILLCHITDSDNKMMISRAATIEDIVTLIWQCSSLGCILLVSSAVGGEGSNRWRGEACRCQSSECHCCATIIL